MSSPHGKLKSLRSLRFHQDTPKVGTHSFDEKVKVAGIRFELKKKICIPLRDPLSISQYHLHTYTVLHREFFFSELFLIENYNACF